MAEPKIEPLNDSRCDRMVSMSVPALGITGMPQVNCGAPIPRDGCPFSHDRHTNCPYRHAE